MADFCKQCSERLFAVDFGDLKDITTPGMTVAGFFVTALCEGCGTIQVDHTGKCVSKDCLERGHNEAHN